MGIKKIGKFEVVSIVIGSIIGTGAFILPGDLFLSKIGFLNTIIGITIGGLLVLAIEKNYSFLIRRFPKAGGEYIFAKKILGKRNAFICGWLLVLSYFTIIPLNATAVPVVINTIFNDVLKFGYLYNINGNIYFGELIVSVLSLLLFLYFNIKGIKFASMVQNVIVFFLVGIIFFFAGALIYINGFHYSILVENIVVPLKFSNILKILTIAPFLFIGFDCIPQITEELNFSTKKLSVIAAFSIFLGGLLYILLTFITAYGVTMKELLTTNINWAAGYSVEYFFSKIGLIFLGLAFLTAIVAGINGFYMSSSRLILAMAKENDLPRFFKGEVNGNPKNALIVLCILGVMASCFGRNTVVWSLDVSSVGAAFGYLYTSFAAFRLNKREKKFSFLGILGSLIGGVFIILLIIPGLPTSLTKASYITFFSWIILGIVFRYFVKYKVDN